jgi:glyceraldehyde-3-phosphate dehydrogenase/erythrose-4-phosphate dehydrogenase
MHKKYRRGRAAGLNMVITETGAGSAVAKALPSLAGKLTSNAIRVPVPNGSLVVLNLEVVKATSVQELNNIMKTYALEGKLVEQIKYSLFVRQTSIILFLIAAKTVLSTQRLSEVRTDFSKLTASEYNSIFAIVTVKRQIIESMSTSSKCMHVKLYTIKITGLFPLRLDLFP